MVNFNWLYQLGGKDTIFHFLVSEADISHVIISGHLIVIVLKWRRLATESIGLEGDIAWYEDNEQESYKRK